MKIQAKSIRWEGNKLFIETFDGETYMFPNPEITIHDSDNEPEKLELTIIAKKIEQ